MCRPDGAAAPAPEKAEDTPAAPPASNPSPAPGEPKPNGDSGSPHSSQGGGAMPSGSMKHGVLTAQTVRGTGDIKPSDEDPSGSKGTEIKFTPGEVSSESAAVRCLLCKTEHGWICACYYRISALCS